MKFSVLGYKTLCVFLIMAFMLMNTGCGRSNTEGTSNNAVKIYCMSKSCTELVWENYVPKRSRLDEQLYELLVMLNTKPSDGDCVELLGKGLNVNDWYFGADGQLILDFDSSYMKLETVPEILCRAGIVKTLSQLNGINYIEFYVDGQPLMHKDSSVGQMRAEDFIDNTGGEINFRQTMTVNVYYADLSGKMMSDILLLVESNGTRSQEEIAVRQIIDGPPENSDMIQATVPEGTELNKLSVRDGVAYVDMNSAFLNHLEGVSDEVIVYSIVNTLCDISDINKVSITVDGNPSKNYGSINLSQLLERRTDLITTENAELLNSNDKEGEAAE